MTVHRLY